MDSNSMQGWLDVVRLSLRSMLLGCALVGAPTALAADVQFTLPDIDKALAELAPHAQQYPLHFSSTAEREAAERTLRSLLRTLDAAVSQYPDEPELLLRDGVANAMGHNLDFDGCDARAIAAYEALLKRQPNSTAGNYYYGTFLASTAALREKSLGYLHAAVKLGMPQAGYSAALVYLSLDDQPHAKAELEQYLKAVPGNEYARQLLDDLVRGKVTVHQRHEPPPR